MLAIAGTRVESVKNTTVAHTFRKNLPIVALVNAGRHRTYQRFQTELLPGHFVGWLLNRHGISQ